MKKIERSYYQGYRERTEIDVIGRQKWNIILEMLWLACYNPGINWRTGEVKMTRYLEECGKQWRPKQGKSGWQKQKEEERKQEEKKKKKKKKKKLKKKKKMEMRKIAEEWEIWDKEKETAKLEAEARRLVSERFYKWIHIFRKKTSEQMPTRKL